MFSISGLSGFHYTHSKYWNGFFIRWRKVYFVYFVINVSKKALNLIKLLFILTKTVRLKYIRKVFYKTT